MKEEKENERTEGNVSLNARYELMPMFQLNPTFSLSYRVCQLFKSF